MRKFAREGAAVSSRYSPRIRSPLGVTPERGGTARQGRGGSPFPGRDGRHWKVEREGSVTDPSAEVVSPVCRYEDIEMVQEVVRAIRAAGAKADGSCGIHIHIGLGEHTPQSLRRLVNIVNAKEDGAGYMYARDGKVTIHKGFMNIGDFLAAVHAEQFTPQDSVVYHFRISTQAGVNAPMTHPFPLSNQPRMMRALDLTCRCGIAHNGVIRLTSDPDNKRYSDTAIFITDYLSRIIRRKTDLKDEATLALIWKLAQSKLAIMDGDGYVATVGHFIDDHGLLFSNDTYQTGWWY